MLWGISGPGAGSQANAEIMADGPLSGKYYLWQFAGWLTDRVELADFSDGDGKALSLWASIEELAAMIDGVFDYDRNGSFYFKPRPLTGTPVATLASDGRADTNRVPDCKVTKGSGSKRV